MHIRLRKGTFDNNSNIAFVQPGAPVEPVLQHNAEWFLHRHWKQAEAQRLFKIIISICLCFKVMVCSKTYDKMLYFALHAHNMKGSDENAHRES